MSAAELHNTDNTGSTVVIACEVMKPELETVSFGVCTEIRYLDQGLHRTPDKMAGLIQAQIDAVPVSSGKIIVAYGLCSNGILGVKSPRNPLVVPRCHDCIALFLGSRHAYKEAFSTRPGTYYLTPGWVAAKRDPLGIIHDDYAPRHGLETALWVMEEELKHYTHIALINTGLGDIEALRQRARENCAALKKEYVEIKGSLDYFRRLLTGPYDSGDFLVLDPGNELRQEMFFGESA